MIFLVVVSLRVQGPSPQVFPDQSIGVAVRRGLKDKKTTACRSGSSTNGHAGRTEAISITNNNIVFLTIRRLHFFVLLHHGKP